MTETHSHDHMRAVSGDLLVLEQHIPLGWVKNTRYHLQQGRLSGPVCPYKTNNFTCANFEGYPLQYPDIPVGGMEIVAPEASPE